MGSGTLSLSSPGHEIRTITLTTTAGPDAGTSVVVGTEKASVGTADGNSLVLTDPTVSRFHLEIAAAPDGLLVTDLESTNGTKVGDTRVIQAVVPPGSTLQLGHTTLQLDEGAVKTVDVVEESSFAGIYGESAVMRRLMALVRDAAASPSSVLVVGESGTGKELVARALHDVGPRADKPFVTVDCTGLPPALIASELFGHERGAFTGADRRHVGAFERADGGTIFLDEIGELPEALQASLLGVLERRSFRRVGGSDEVSVDVRVVSATNRDLRNDVNGGAFRLDLFYRIAVVVLELPPLRTRKDDIPLLVEHFLRQCGYDGPADDVFPRTAISAMKKYRWPGNVRELRNMVEATLAIGEAPLFDHETKMETDDPIGQLLDLPYRHARRTLIEMFERRYLSRLMEVADGNVSQASRTAKMDRSHLNDLLRRHKLR